MTIYDFRTFPKPPPQLDDIEAHILYFKREIYDKPYPSGKKRLYHDIRHVMRAMLFGVSSVNLMRHLGFIDSLNPRLLKLITIALLLHDSGREGDEEDLWDSDSATNVYNYLKQMPGVTEEEAKLTAEAMRNKDCFDKNTRYFMQVSPKGDVIWEIIPLREYTFSSKQNAMSFSIQFGDCVDIIRAVERFIDHYLIFSRVVVQNDPAKIKLLSKLLIEARRIIALQGDLFNDHNIELQKKYEANDLYQLMCNELRSHCPHFTLLYAAGELLENATAQQLVFPVDQEFKLDRGVTAENVLAAMNEGKLLFRMVPVPSAISAKSRTLSAQETMVELELRKIYRRKGQATRSGALDKEGNAGRSVTMGGYGVPLMSCSGYFTLHRNAADICSVSLIDAWTPVANKLVETINLPEKAEADREMLLNYMMRGAGTAELNELEYNIVQFDGIVYTLDPVSFYGTQPNRLQPTQIIYQRPLHRATAILEAYYEQLAFLNKHQRHLPVFEYSSAHHSILLKQFTEEEIIALWGDAVRTWLVKSFAADIKANPAFPLSKDAWHYTIDELKIYALYSPQIITWRGSMLPLDSNYPKLLQDKLNQALLDTKAKTLEFIKSRLCDKTTPLQEHPLSDIAFSFLADQALLQDEIARLKDILDDTDESSVNKDFKALRNFVRLASQQSFNRRYVKTIVYYLTKYIQQLAAQSEYQSDCLLDLCLLIQIASLGTDNSKTLAELLCCHINTMHKRFLNVPSDQYSDPFWEQALAFYDRLPKLYSALGMISSMANAALDEFQDKQTALLSQGRSLRSELKRLKCLRRFYKMRNAWGESEQSKFIHHLQEAIKNITERNPRAAIDLFDASEVIAIYIECAAHVLAVQFIDQHRMVYDHRFSLDAYRLALENLFRNLKQLNFPLSEPYSLSLIDAITFFTPVVSLWGTPDFAVISYEIMICILEHLQELVIGKRFSVSQLALLDTKLSDYFLRYFEAGTPNGFPKSVGPIAKFYATHSFGLKPPRIVIDRLITTIISAKEEANNILYDYLSQLTSGANIPPDQKVLNVLLQFNHSNAGNIFIDTQIDERIVLKMFAQLVPLSNWLYGRERNKQQSLTALSSAQQQHLITCLNQLVYIIENCRGCMKSEKAFAEFKSILAELLIQLLQWHHDYKLSLYEWFSDRNLAMNYRLQTVSRWFNEAGLSVQWQLFIKDTAFNTHYLSGSRSAPITPVKEGASVGLSAGIPNITAHIGFFRGTSAAVNTDDKTDVNETKKLVKENEAPLASTASHSADDSGGPKSFSP